MRRFMVVVPTGAWTMCESVNLAGRPANHIVPDDEDTRTLCGRPCGGWMIQSGIYNRLRASVEEVGTHGMCKICLRKWQALRVTEEG